VQELKVFDQGLVAEVKSDFTQKLENIAVKLNSNGNAGIEIINNKISALPENLVAKIKEVI